MSLGAANLCKKYFLSIRIAAIFICDIIEGWSGFVLINGMTTGAAVGAHQRTAVLSGNRTGIQRDAE
jgi:hypothetical protein